MKVPVSIPFLSDNDKKFANLALDKAAISGIYGNYISDFEKKFAEYCGVKYSITCSNGTTAIHLALVSAGIKKGDEVLVSTLTNMATFFAVLRASLSDLRLETCASPPAVFFVALLF